MQRGDVVVIAQKGEGKPRPAIIIQNEELLADHPSILVCLLTASNDPMGEAFYRIPIEPDSVNGLRTPSLILVDKIATIRRENIGSIIGSLDETRLERLNTALATPKRTAAASGSQAPMIDVVSVRPVGGFRLRIAFSDGSAGVHDFSSIAARTGEMVQPLKEPAFFARVFVELGALTSPNGYDIDPIALHDRMSAAK
jgi:mRNA-degrading endonuclease toxin of MazEF toxin-antitoxin module